MIFVRDLCNFSYYSYVCHQLETIERPGGDETILMHLGTDKESFGILLVLDKTFSIRSVQGVITCLREFLKSVFQQTGCILLFSPALSRHVLCQCTLLKQARSH